MIEKEHGLTKGIHNLVRGTLTWEKSWELLSEVVESKEWIEYWKMEIILAQFFNAK